MGTETVIALALQFGLKYGPEIGIAVAKLFDKKESTMADVVAIFEMIKPYEAYNIPELIKPTVPPTVPA